MNLKQALQALSKSSPTAVTTAGEIEDPHLRAIKEYLYVKTPIENVLIEKLHSVNSDTIIFLCGSSGDGKSEILTRCQKEFNDKVMFHLDATHSFDPDQTAIETLDKVFDSHSERGQPLVVGINIGMLANYEREGAERHQKVKAAINCFLSNSSIERRYIFISFEDYPKFNLSNGSISSDFFSSLMKRIVMDNPKNPFRDLFNRELSLVQNQSAEATTKKLVSNYLMLRDQGVQSAIIELIFCARVKQDKFVTTRMMLDFLSSILIGEKYLYDNIFDGGDNELLDSIAEFDPALIRSKSVDHFILNQMLSLEDENYKEFRDEAKSKFLIDSRGKSLPQSRLRQLFLLRNAGMYTNYPRHFEKSFTDLSTKKYSEAWELHKRYSGDPKDKKLLKEFYDGTILTAICTYANRHAPFLAKDDFYLSTRGSTHVATSLELSIKYKDIETYSPRDIYSFNIFISVNGKTIPAVPVNANLLALMTRVVNGFRPNKYDKNSIVLLEELVENIRDLIHDSDILYLFQKGERVAKLKNNLDNDIRVSGI